MKLVNCDQGTAEWLQARCGKVTGSRIKDVLDMTAKGKPGAKRDAYMIELVTERLTGSAVQHYVNADMQRGTDLEPLARSSYEIEYDCSVDQYGFVLHPTISLAGYSPDGLCDRKLIEIKCPRATTHVKWMLGGVLPEEHEPQVSFGMCCCEADEADFLSFCPEMPENLQLWRVNVKRNQDRIEAINAEVRKFLAEVDEMHRRICASTL